MSSLISYKTLVVSLLLMGMASIAAVIYLGIEKRDVVVEDNPYDAGTEFESALKRKAELGWEVTFPDSLDRGDSRMAVTLRDRRGRAINDATVSLRLNRLGSPNVEDYRLGGNGDGQYEADVHLEEAGYWDVSARVRRGADIVRFDGRVRVR